MNKVKRFRFVFKINLIIFQIKEPLIITTINDLKLKKTVEQIRALLAFCNSFHLVNET